jgi:hypothetical protein
MPGVPRSAMVKLSLLFATTAVVCLAQIPPSDSVRYAAKALTVSGQVSVLKDLQPWAVSEGDTIQVQQRIVTGLDGHALFQVSDGSTFEVFPNSVVTFRKNPPNWKDLIDVWVGKVRLHIEHLGASPNPNRIHTPTAVISVRGTTFDISVDDDDETTLIEVEEGSVQVEHNLLPTGTAAVVNAGQTLRVYKNVPIARRMDKGGIFREILRVAMDAAVIAGQSGGTAHTGIPTGGVGGTSGGGTVGDTAPPAAPPPPTTLPSGPGLPPLP